jgi:hypothetical protein
MLCSKSKSAGAPAMIGNGSFEYGHAVVVHRTPLSSTWTELEHRGQIKSPWCFFNSAKPISANPLSLDGPGRERARRGVGAKP